jgi:uncharacterized protein YbjT (DUF2867 family)
LGFVGGNRAIIHNYHAAPDAMIAAAAPVTARLSWTVWSPIYALQLAPGGNAYGRRVNHSGGYSVC